MRLIKKIVCSLVLFAGLAYADTTTSNLGLTLPTTGQADNWGRKLNTNFLIIDSSAATRTGSNTWNGSNVFVSSVSISTLTVHRLLVSTPIYSGSDRVAINGTAKIGGSGSSLFVCDNNWQNCGGFQGGANMTLASPGSVSVNIVHDQSVNGAIVLKSANGTFVDDNSNQPNLLAAGNVLVGPNWSTLGIQLESSGDENAFEYAVLVGTVTNTPNAKLLVISSGAYAYSFYAGNSLTSAQLTVSTSGVVAIPALASGECVQTSAGGVLTTTGAGCGSGGGGSSSLATSQDSVRITSPTANINFGGGKFLVTLGGSATAQVLLVSSAAFTTLNQTWTAPQTWASSGTFSLVGGSTVVFSSATFTELTGRHIYTSTITLNNFPTNVPAYVDAAGNLNARAIDLESTDVDGVLQSDFGGTGHSLYEDGILLIGNSNTGRLSTGTITAGSNITVTNGPGTITIASTGGGSGTASTLGVFKGDVSISSPTGGISFAGEGVALSLLGSNTAQVTIVSTTAYTSKKNTWTTNQTFTSTTTIKSLLPHMLTLDYNDVSNPSAFIKASSLGTTYGYFGFRMADVASPYSLSRGFEVQNANTQRIFSVETTSPHRTVVDLGGLSMFTTSQLRLYDTSNTKYVGFRSSDTVAHDQNYLLPASTAAVGSVLEIGNIDSNGNTVLTWASDDTGAGGGGGYALEPATVTIQANKGISASTMVVTSSGSYTLLAPTAANFFNISMQDDLVKFRYFQSGVNDNYFTWATTGTVMPTAMYIGGGNTMTSEGALRSRAAGAGGGITDAGMVNLWSSGGTGNYVSFNETGVSNNGTLGFAAGSTDLVFKSGAENITGGTVQMTVSPTTGFSVSTATVFRVTATTITVGSVLVWPDGSTSTSSVFGAGGGGSGDITAVIVAGDGLIGGASSGDATITIVSTVAYTTKNQTFSVPQTFTSSVTLASAQVEDLSASQIVVTNANKKLSSQSVIYSTATIQFKCAALDKLETNFAVNTATNTGTSNKLTCSFDNSTRQYVNGFFMVPNNLDTAGTITIRTHGRSSTAAASKAVGWILEHQPLANGESNSGTYLISASSGLAVSGTQSINDSLSWNMSVSSSTWAANDIVNFRFAREVGVNNNLASPYYNNMIVIEIPVTAKP